MYDYGECHICGKQMKEMRINQDLWVKGKLILIEGVPAGVCPQCGERVVKADVGLRIAALIEDSRHLRRVRTIRVPVIRFEKEIA